MKKLKSQIGKRFGCYQLMKEDMLFSAYLFTRSAHIRGKIPQDWKKHDQIREAMMETIMAADPVLRQGASLYVEDHTRNSDQDDCRAFFEAGIVTYAKCFNSNLRVKLSKDIFRGNLQPNRKLHDWMMNVRNQHIAHSDLQRESFVIGFDLVDDPLYGARPSGTFGIVLARREVPLATKLTDMASHCITVVREHIDPEIIEVGRQIREQMLKLPKQQFDALPEFLESDANEVGDEDMWHEQGPVTGENPSSGEDR